MWCNLSEFQRYFDPVLDAKTYRAYTRERGEGETAQAALGERERGAWWWWWWCVCGRDGFTQYVSAAVETTGWIHT